MTVATQEPFIDSPAAPPPPARLTAAHVAGFLIGRREAILTAARDRATLGVGLLFIAAAALAREYDQEDLLREPWHLFIPLGASLVLSLAIFLVVRRKREPAMPFWKEYRVFLALFWLTAPLALLYAIPFERFLSPAGAVRANLITLGIVAAWRIALMTRIVSVFTSRSTGRSFVLVMVVADAFAAGALLLLPLPVLQVMGGIQLSASELILQQVGMLARVVSVLTLPIWLIAALVLSFSRKPLSELSPPIDAIPPDSRADGWPAMIALTCVGMIAMALPVTQGEQRRRSEVEQQFAAGRIESALVFMSRHDRDAYPPAWDPPPRFGWEEPEFPDLLDVMKVIVERPVEPWVRAIYLDKFERRWIGGDMLRWQWQRFPEVDAVLQRLPERDAILQKHGDYIDSVRATYLADQAAATQPATQKGVP